MKLMRRELQAKPDSLSATTPVIIGGVGGSGTRLIARILLELGFYLGSDLNESLDNLWFTLLFKRPGWYKANLLRSRSSITKTMDVFKRAMLSGPLKIGDATVVLGAALPMTWTGHSPGSRGRGIWPLRRAWNILARKAASLQGATGWGWKEPNTHIYLEELIMVFPDLKYINVVRHGLDMALSRNQQQLMNWGFLFGLGKPRTVEEIPRLSLKYWVLANHRVASLGESLGERFLTLNFDMLCLYPEKYMGKILSFLDLDLDEDAFRRLCLIPKPPSTMGRYRSVELSRFDGEDVEEVEKMGFQVERRG